MRTLFNTVQNRSWPTRGVEVGCGKRSCLTFLYARLVLQQQRAEDLLEQNHINQLVQLVDDKAIVQRTLVSHLSRNFRQGQCILYVFYHHPLRNSLPNSALRRFKTHIVRQTLSSLTHINEEDGELEADIARR